ncbi:MAG: substrate-binding domain-containing protein [Planctomycetota bacterium]
MSRVRISSSLLGLLLCLLVTLTTNGPAGAQTPEEQESVQGLGALLQSIHPYIPSEEVTSEIDVFGSTSMDRLAHGWAMGFRKFHPKATVTISAEGSETAFDRIANSPNSIAMLSRPATEKDLVRLKEKGMKQPAVVFVAREPLGVFVHPSNPLRAIDYETLSILFCQSTESDGPITWGTLGLDGDYQSKPVKTIGRGTNSGTFTFLKNNLFRGREMRELTVTANSNFEVVSSVAKDPQAVAVSGLRRGGHKARTVPLTANGSLIPSDDRSLLSGRYPMMRSFCLVFDLGQEGKTATANREFVRYAITQAGQNEAVLAGFLPYDPESLRAQELRIGLNREDAAEETPEPAIKP